jgi:hypothetical protein
LQVLYLCVLRQECVGTAELLLQIFSSIQCQTSNFYHLQWQTSIE